MEQANFIARAKHLKIASILWWLLRPYRIFAWKFAPAWWTKPSKKSGSSSVWRSPTKRVLTSVFVDERGAAAEIDRDYGERFIHWHDEVAGAVDSPAVAERFREELAQHDARVFHGVVLIDVKIAHGFQLQIEAAVLGEELQHVIQEANAGRDFIAAFAFDFERAADLRFFGIALNCCCYEA